MAQNTTALKTVVFADRTKDIVWGRDDYGCWTFADSTVESHYRRQRFENNSRYLRRSRQVA